MFKLQIFLDNLMLTNKYSQESRCCFLYITNHGFRPRLSSLINNELVELTVSYPLNVQVYIHEIYM